MNQPNTDAAHLDKVIGRITAAAQQVWHTRAKIGHTWPLPDQVDCLAFAVTEISEAIRARLTAARKYNLNHPRDVDERAELADTAMMLISFLGEHYDYQLMHRRLSLGAPQRMLGMDHRRRITPQPLSTIASLVGTAYHLAHRAEDTVDMPYMLVEETLALIAAGLPDLHRLVGARLDRIAGRVGGRSREQHVRLADLAAGCWFQMGATRYRVLAKEGPRIKVYSDVADGGPVWFQGDTVLRPDQVLGGRQADPQPSAANGAKGGMP